MSKSKKVKEEQVKLDNGYSMYNRYRLYLKGRFHAITRCGIYKLSIAGKYYIGRTNNIKRRGKQHRAELSKVIGGNLGWRDDHYLRKFFEHLQANPDERDLLIEVLEDCEQVALLEYEQKWLTACEGDPNCLNMGFVARSSSGETRELNKSKNNSPC